MRRLLSTICLFLFALGAHAAEPAYDPDVSTWHEIVVPAKSDRDAREKWHYAANSSSYQWRVFAKDGQIQAQLDDRAAKKSRLKSPGFVPKADGFEGGNAFAVDDGWLVAFNRGEFGAALYWFSVDGASNYKISDHQVVDIFTLPDGVYAIEGLAHGMGSRGAVIRIARPGVQWTATPAVELPFAPYAQAVRQDGSVLITLSDALVSMQAGKELQTLLPAAPFGGLYPGSSILSPDEQKLYIGMRQFVGEFDLKTRTLRLLVPSDAFLNKRLPVILYSRRQKAG